MPAGQLWSTVEDLCRFAVLLLNGADGVLSADTVEEPIPGGVDRDGWRGASDAPSSPPSKDSRALS